MKIGGALEAIPLLKANIRRVVVLLSFVSRMKSFWRVNLFVAMIGQFKTIVPGSRRVALFGTLSIVLDRVRRLFVEKL